MKQGSDLYEVSVAGTHFKKRQFRYGSNFDKDQKFDFEGITAPVTENVTNKLYIVNEVFTKCYI